MLLLAVIMLGFAVFLAGEVATAPQRRRHVALRRASSYGAVRKQAGPEVLRFKERVLAPSVERLAGLALRLNPRVSSEAIGTRLIAAGLAARISTTQFLALKGSLAIGGAAASLMLAVTTKPVAGIVLAPVLGGLGFRVPDFVLSLRIRARRERIRSELPDALDLLAVSVEAGLDGDGE